MRFIQALSVILLAFVLGCHKQNSPSPVVAQGEHQRQEAMSYLQRAISSQATTTLQTDLEKYRDANWREALAFLKQPAAERNVRFPYLVLASCVPTDEHSEGMSLLWLEPGFEVTGIRLADKNGMLGEFACISPYTPDERKAYASTLVRSADVYLSKADGSSAKPGAHSNQISLPRAVDGPTLQIWLLRSGKSPSQPAAPFLYGRKVLLP